MACLLILPATINAAGIFYEEISEADGNSIIEESMQRTPTIHKSFHQCSLTENCNYVIKDLANGKFYRYKNKHDLPHNTKGLRIWKKVYHGKLIFNGQSVVKAKLTFSKVEFVKKFSMATYQSHFLFNGKVFDQLDGVAVGSPLAPVLASLFLGHHENL